MSTATWATSHVPIRSAGGPSGAVAALAATATTNASPENISQFPASSGLFDFMRMSSKVLAIFAISSAPLMPLTICRACK